MKNLAYNLNSVEIFYGDNTLTSVIQIDERIDSIAEYLRTQDPFPEIKQMEIVGRLDKLVTLNQKIQHELAMQAQKLNDIKSNLNKVEMKLS